MSVGGARYQPRDGIIAGYVLKLARESAGLTQPALAEALDVDTGTLQSWESGRRSLAATSVRDFVRLRLCLLNLGVRPRLIDAIDDALSADHILDHALDAGDADPAAHPLAGWLLPRVVSNMLGWPLTGVPPASLRGLSSLPRRRGPVPAGPTLTSDQRERFFANLRATADRLRASPLVDHERRALFVQQAYYRAGWDEGSESRAWLYQAHGWHARASEAGFRWSADWLASRSLVIALACHGDPEPLRHFVRTGHQSDQTETANLNYWAYWVGELGERQRSQSFMPRADVLQRWRGGRLLGHLVERLPGCPPDVELNIHSLATLLERPVPRHLLEHDAALASSLRVSLDLLTSGSVPLSAHARRELDRVAARTPASTWNVVETSR